MEEQKKKATEKNAKPHPLADAVRSMAAPGQPEVRLAVRLPDGTLLPVIGVEMGKAEDGHPRPFSKEAKAQERAEADRRIEPAGDPIVSRLDRIIELLNSLLGVC